MTQLIATIIVPQDGNDGRCLAAERVDLQASLILHFEGYSNWHGKGADVVKTHDHAGYVRRESVWFYRVACGDNEVNVATLRSIAHQFCIAAEQDSVYLEIQRAVEVEFIVR